MKLAIISHTEHYLDDKGNPVGWGATVREINNLLKIFSEVIHIAPLHSGKAPGSSLGYTSDKIKFIPLVPSGGEGIRSKIKIVTSAPKNLKIIKKTLDAVDYVQFRGPTNLGLYVIPYLSLRKHPKRWFKYAGNWAEENPPLSYALQRWWLKANFQKATVTVNGKWPNQEDHVISFENPCITDEELREGRAIAEQKNFEGPLTLCFVGRVETAKGVGRIIEAFKEFSTDLIRKIIFVGDGPERPALEEKAKILKVDYEFKGSLTRYEIADVYKDSHIFCLPSTASEGFPKVIAEAAAYGCVPVVSSISSIGQYVKNNENGLLLNSVRPDAIEKDFRKLLEDRKQMKYLSGNVVNIAGKFTYDHYNSRILNEVLPALNQV